MSLGELLACVQGSLATGGGSRWCPVVGKMAVPPDNTCCFCLTLRTGVIGIGTFNFALYLIVFLWYASTAGFQSGFGEPEISNMDISIFLIFCLQLMVNLLLIFGAMRRIPHHTFPWLCSNAVVIGLLMIFVVMLVFFGAGRHSLNYQEYVTCLAILSLLAGINMFCCIVVFQFRQNLLQEARIAALGRPDDCLWPGGGEPAACTAPVACAPPPSYEELASLKVPLDQGPPDYDAAVAFRSANAEDDLSSSGGAVHRKKSLTCSGV